MLKPVNINIVFGFFVALLSISYFCLSSYASEKSQSSTAPLVTVSGENRILKDVVAEVAKQSGYRVEISESLLDYKVTGEYVDMDLEVFFRRILKGSDLFQVVDVRNKTITILATVRKQGRVLVVGADSDGSGEDVWLDGEPNKTTRDLLQARKDAYQNYDPEKQTLDGESGKTTGDLLRDRDEVFSNYDIEQQVLDGEQEKTTGDLLRDRDEAFSAYDFSEQSLDGESEKTTGELLRDRDKAFSNYNPLEQPLDGEPGKTFQDLLDERDLAFAKRTY